jgi:hypothetical protein
MLLTALRAAADAERLMADKKAFGTYKRYG